MVLINTALGQSPANDETEQYPSNLKNRTCGVMLYAFSKDGWGGVVEQGELGACERYEGK